MAEIKTAVIAILNQTPSVFALFGNRIWADKLEDSPTYPCGRVWLVANDDIHTLTHKSHSNALVQLDLYDDDILGADAGADAVVKALDGWKGSSNGVDIKIIFAALKRGLYNEVVRKYQRIIELEISANA